jgi:X-X-X-Leu-X-X-Gly heptad repeat protein
VRSAVGDIGGKAKGAGKSAGKTVGKVASKAKVPLVAGGAAVAGAAGGMALAASKKGRKGGIGKALANGSKAMPRRPKVKVKSKDVAKAAKGVGNFSAQVAEIADGIDTAASGRNGRHRSPVEVVLQGLTARR